MVTKRKMPTIANPSEKIFATDPCIELIAAVVSRAVLDATKTEEPFRQEARDWVSSKEATVMSFLWCCDVLDLDSEAVRGIILGSSANIRTLGVRKVARAIY